LRILVTGGTGFVGSNLARRLISLGNDVWITGREGENGVPEGTTMVEWDGAGEMSFDVCFHQSANNDTLDDDSSDMLESNVFAPARLFHRLARKGCDRFVYASSTAVYGNSPAPYSEQSGTDPMNVYAKSKLAFDEFAPSFAEDTRTKVFGLRYCNVYGPGESHKGRRASMIMHLCLQMVDGRRPRIFRHGEQRRAWVHVDDVVEANLACLGPEVGGLFNVAGESATFNRVVEMINESLGSNLEPDYIECPFEDRYQKDTDTDTSKARRVLGWSPKVSIAEGIASYLPLLGASL
jgi:ADP-L-glycero-D-manno-heptose 6-epimerase